MKDVTLRFREVAVDGLPEKSMDCVVIRTYYENDHALWELPYSDKYNGFNLHDFSDDDHTRMEKVTHWMPHKEFEEAFGSGLSDEI